MLLERIKGIINDTPLDELKAQFEEYKRVCENIKPHRNKRIGHTDIKRAEDPTFKWLPAVTLEEVDDTLGVLRRIMRGLLLALRDRDYDYDPDLELGRDGNRLLYLLRKAHEQQLNTPGTEGVV
jgi:AbiU2